MRKSRHRPVLVVEVDPLAAHPSAAAHDDRGTDRDRGEATNPNSLRRTVIVVPRPPWLPRGRGFGRGLPSPFLAAAARRQLLRSKKTRPAVGWTFVTAATARSSSRTTKRLPSLVAASSCTRPSPSGNTCGTLAAASTSPDGRVDSRLVARIVVERRREVLSRRRTGGPRPRSATRSPSGPASACGRLHRATLPECLLEPDARPEARAVREVPG